MIRKKVIRNLESLLVKSGKITVTDLENALKKQDKKGKRLEEILVEENIITEKEILELMEVYLGIKQVELSKVTISPDVIKSVPEALVNKYSLIPIDIKNGKIIVAMSNPLDLFAADDVKFASGYDVEPVLASKDDIKIAIENFYAKQSAQRAVEDLKNEYTPAAEDAHNDKYLDEVNNAPAVRLVNSIINQAVKERVSDIHIEPYENYIKVRFRIDGQLKEVMRAAKQTLPAIITRIKIIASLNIAERRLPQDGRVMVTINGKNIDIRVSILPTIFGEKAVLRVLDRESFLVKKNAVGFNRVEMIKVDNMIRSPYGIILITGPTGSGKSTTLYTLLNELNTENRNIVTVEDPVEYMMEGINQVYVNTKIGMTFASGLRAILRQDPDIIMIGEIRDNETAEIAIRAAITGHLVLTTLHTNDAPSAITRLVDMGIQPYLLSSAIVGVIAQRLVRKICPKCKYGYDASNDEKNMLGIGSEQNIKLYKGKGCDMCNQTGYNTRTGLFEVMEFTKNHKDALSRSASSQELKDISINAGMKTLRQNCIDLVQKGITTVDELVKMTFIKD